MQSNIDTALRNAKQVEVPSSTLEKVDNVLRTLEQRKGITHMKPKYKKLTVVAAVIAISVLALSTVALAYTGVLSGIFPAITGGSDIEGEFGTDTRKAIVENEFVSELPSHASTSDDGSTLELSAYFVDEREIWFDFTLSNADIPDGWNPEEHQVLFGLFSLEMIQGDGTSSKWESIIEEGSERTTFPGGHAFNDWANNNSEFTADDDSHVFVTNQVSSFADDGSLEITLIVNFSYPYPAVGEKIHLEVGNLLFNIVDHDLFVEGADNTAAIQRIWLDGVWEFKLDIDSRFTDVTGLTYEVINADEAAQLGIIIHSITVTPTATRVEATIDFSKNNLMNPDYMVIHDSITIYGDGDSVTVENPSGQEIIDMGLIHLAVYAVSENGQHRGSGGSQIEQNGDITEGWWEFGSMYFESPESLVLIFETIVLGGEFTGAEIRIPLMLSRQG